LTITQTRLVGDLTGNLAGLAGDLTENLAGELVAK
jgi:hypothetical protein